MLDHVDVGEWPCGLEVYFDDRDEVAHVAKGMAGRVRSASVGANSGAVIGGNLAGVLAPISAVSASAVTSLTHLGHSIGHSIGYSGNSNGGNSNGNGGNSNSGPYQNGYHSVSAYPFTSTTTTTSSTAPMTHALSANFASHVTPLDSDALIGRANLILRRRLLEERLLRRIDTVVGDRLAALAPLTAENGHVDVHVGEHEERAAFVDTLMGCVSALVTVAEYGGVEEEGPRGVVRGVMPRGQEGDGRVVAVSGDVTPPSVSPNQAFATSPKKGYVVISICE